LESLSRRNRIGLSNIYPIYMQSIAAVIVAAQFIVTLEPKTVQSFDSYFGGVDSAMRARAAAQGSLAGTPPGVTPHLAGKDTAGNGMLHDWSAITFIPGAKKQAAISVIEDVPNHPKIYPEVIDGRIKSRQANGMTASHRIRKKKVLEVTIDSTYQIDILPTPPNRYASRSVATELVEVEDAGTAKERRLPPGRDHGFLWRLNTFWIVEETPKGLWLECRSVSLTRDTPTGLGWAIRPIVRDLPRESLLGLLEATKRAIEAR